MTVHLEPGAAERCIDACDNFIGLIADTGNADEYFEQGSANGGFDTARQIGTVYSLFAGEDLRTLLNGFVDQAKAMSMLFAAAGGLIDAQDEAVAAALGKAAAEPAVLQSLGLMGSIGSLSTMLDAVDGQTPAYSRVGPEDVSATPLERMVSGAQALDPGQFEGVEAQVTNVATTLRQAAGALHGGLSDVLGSQWQGQFATEAQTSVQGLTTSADQLATTLDRVAEKAGLAAGGFGTTRSKIGSEASSITMLEITTPGFGGSFGPASPTDAAEMAAAREAAEEQARATMNTVYSPAVMDANLDDLDFPTAYRVVSTSALGGPNGVDLANIWNDDAVIRPATPGTPSESAIAAATGGASGGGATGGASGGGVPSPSQIGGGAAPTDAATEQALLASRAGGETGLGAGAGAGASAAGAGGTGAVGGGAGVGGGTAGVGGVNAGTAAAAAGAPMMNSATSQRAGASGVAGGRMGSRATNRSTERGFGSAAGLLGGGGATAAGAGAAARMGGAGTLSGIGAPGIGVPGGVGKLGVPLAGTAIAGGPPGAFSNSSVASTSAGRVGGAPMGMVGGARGAGQGDKNEGHRPASYLVNATNASEILGDPVKVSPAKIGGRPELEQPVERQPASVSPGQALVNKLKGTS